MALTERQKIAVLDPWSDYDMRQDMLNGMVGMSVDASRQPIEANRCSNIDCPAPVVEVQKVFDGRTEWPFCEYHRHNDIPKPSQYLTIKV